MRRGQDCILYAGPLGEARVRNRILGILAMVILPGLALGQSSGQTAKTAPAAKKGLNAAQVSEEKIIKAEPLALNSVRLTGGPLKNAQDLDAKYLLELEPDRMLAHLRERAGLKPKAKGYGGWD